MEKAEKLFMTFVGIYRRAFEYLANNLELKIWKNRQKIVFIGICYGVAYPTYKILTGGFTILNSSYGIEASSLAFFAIFLVLFIFIEFYLRFRKLFPNFISPGTRLFAGFAYFWIWVELTLSYFDYAVEFLTGILEQNLLDRVVAFTIPILQFYMDLPGTRYGIVGYLTFFLFFYGIGRNKEAFNFFTRYHYIQAILFGALFSFQNHLFSIFVRLNVDNDESTLYFGLLLYSICLLILFTGFCSALLGLETQFPFMHDAIQYHTGRKENEGKNPLDI